MAKLIMILMFMFCVNCNTISAADEANVNEAQAALAMAKATQMKCVCHDDIEKCRVESSKTGKPLVLSVNTSCEGISGCFKWAIFCKVKSYNEEGVSDPTTKRFVIISPDKVDGELFLRTTLPIATKFTDFETALSKASKVIKYKKPLNWV
jgi:hypothetical protein